MELTDNILNLIRSFIKDNEDSNSIEDLSIIYKDKFISTDGDFMKEGFYFYIKDYPEEGLVGPFIDEKEYCPQCHKLWLDHEFAVPAPYCPYD